MYKIFETNEFIKKLRNLSNREKIFISKKLNNFVYPQLRIQPHYGNNIKKLVIIILEHGDTELVASEYFM